MDINSLEGQTVRITIAGIQFQDPQIRPKISLEHDTLTLPFLVESVDQLGLWVRYPDFPVYNNVLRKKEKHNAMMLIRFEYITSIVHFPELEEDDSKFSRIGFIADDDH